MNVPFYLNEGRRCGEAALMCALAAVAPERKFTFNDLERLLMHNKEGEIVFPSQIAFALKRLNVPFRYFTKPAGLLLATSPGFEDCIRGSYGKDANKILLGTNIESVNKSATGLIGCNGVVERPIPLSIDRIGEYIKNDCVPISLINYDLFVKREDSHNGHYIVLTGIDGNHITYHETGPSGAGANRRVSKSTYEKSRDLCFFDHGLIIVGDEKILAEVDNKRDWDLYGHNFDEWA